MFAFKIGIIANILLTAYGGLSDSDDVMCEGREGKCHSEEAERVQFPENIEALDSMCPFITKRLGCLLDYQNKCGTARPGSIDQTLGTAHQLSLEACDKHSELHKDFADNLPCLKSLVNNHFNTCHPIVVDAMEAVKTRISFQTDGNEELDEEDYRKLTCLRDAFDFACLVARAGVICGSEAKEFVGRILDRVGLLDALCHADIRDEVKGMVEIIQLKMEETIAFGGILSKK